jgi:hypothetical protein
MRIFLSRWGVESATQRMPASSSKQDSKHKPNIHTYDASDSQWVAHVLSPVSAKLCQSKETLFCLGTLLWILESRRTIHSLQFGDER